MSAGTGATRTRDSDCILIIMFHSYRWMAKYRKQNVSPRSIGFFVMIFPHAFVEVSAFVVINNTDTFILLLFPLLLSIACLIRS